MTRSRPLAAVLAVLAVVCAAVALWPTPSAGPTRRGALLAPVLSMRRVPAFVSQTIASSRLRGRLDAVLGGRGQSCLIVDEERGQRLYEKNPAQLLLPASTIKLLTATAVLDRIPAAEPFRTELRARQLPVNGVVAGDVWLVGAGDPLLAVDAFAATAGYQPVS